MDAPQMGPYVRAALFAETIIEEKTGVKTAVRIFDQWTALIQGPNPPAALPPVTRQLNALISLKPGEAKGRKNFALKMETPDGLRHQQPVAEGSIHFQGGPNRGVDINLSLNITFEQEGLYWFDLELDGHLLTRMPFELLYSRMVTPPGPQLA